MSSIDRLRKIVRGEEPDTSRLNNFSNSGAKPSSVIYTGNGDTGYEARSWDSYENTRKRLSDIVRGKDTGPKYVSTQQSLENTNGFWKSDDKTQNALHLAITQRAEKYKDYDYAQLREAESKADNDADKEWLKKKADEVATSKEMQAYRDDLENNKVKEIKNKKQILTSSLDNGNYKEYGYSNPAQVTKAIEELDEKGRALGVDISKYEALIEQKKYKEKEQREYYDVVDNNVRTKTILQKYHNLQKYNEIVENTHYLDGMQGMKIPLDKQKYYLEYGSGLTKEEKSKIVKDFESLDNKDVLYKYYSRNQNEADTRGFTEQTKKIAKEHPVIASAYSIGANTAGAISDVGTYIGAGLDKTFGGDGYINPENTNVAQAQQIRDTVSKDMNGLGQFLYSTGMSMADFISLLPLNVLPGGKAASLAMMGMSSGASAANTVIENGGDVDKAILTGICAGAAEAFFEKFSIERLKAFATTDSPKSIKDLALNFFKGMFTEGSEEVATSLANTVTDGIINGNMSSYELAHQRYMDDGMSEEDANKAALADWAKQIALDFAGGAISGGVIGGGVSVVSYANAYKNGATAGQIGKRIKSEKDFNLNEYIKQAKNSVNEKAVKLATKLEDILNKNKSVSDVDLGNLFVLTNNLENTKNTSSGVQASQNYSVENSSINKTKEAVLNLHSFGKYHKNGIAASHLGKSIGIVSVNSSSKNYGDADNTVVFKTKDGELVKGDEVVFSESDFNHLLNAAKNFDTMGARALFSVYDDYVEYSKGNADVGEFLNAFSVLYEIGKTGAKFDNVSKNGYYSNYINKLGLSARRAVVSGNLDVNDYYKIEANKMQKIPVPNSENSKVYVENESADSINPSAEQLEVLQILATKTGRDIVITDKLSVGENAYYNLSNGRIYISSDLDESYIIATGLHEACHGIRQSSPHDFKILSDFVINYLIEKGKNVERLLDDIKHRWGNRVSSREDLLEELVCQSVMSIASDENALKIALQSKETKNKLKEIALVLKDLAKKVYNYIKGIGTAAHNEQAQAWLEDAKALEELAEKFSAAAEKTKIVEVAELKNQAVQSNSDDKKYSMAGRKSKTANLSLLQQAEQMEQDGRDSEYIRKTTGWFRGYDSKWRYEIDDSKLILLKKIGNYNLIQETERELKKTKAELAKLKNLTAEQIQIKKRNSLALGLEEWSLEKSVNKYTDKINSLNKKLEDMDTDNILKVGTYRLDEIIKHEELFKAYPQLENCKVFICLNKDFENENIAGSYIESENSIYINIQNPKIILGNVKDTLIHEIQHAVQHIEGFASGANSSNKNYYNVAGEIESRDVSSRINLTEEERKNTRPDIDREDVVFAEGTNISYSYIGQTKDGRRCYRSSFDSSVSIDVRVKLFKERIATIFNLGGVELKTDVKRIHILGDKFTAQKNLFGDKMNKPSEQNAKINSLYDLADILSTSKYDSKATAKEDSYANPGVKPKNKAHSGVKYWYKFRNEIVLDDIPYTVTFNIRDKGNRQYQYLIEFKENKTSGLSNTVANDLLRTDQMSYDSSIPNETENVNNNSMQEDKNNTNKFSVDDILNKSDLKLALDDTIAESIWGEDLDFENDFERSKSDFEEILNNNPSVANALILRAAAKTAEKGIQQSNDVKLSDDIYNTIAKKLMIKYSIDRKLNPNYQEELVEVIKSFVSKVENGDYSTFVSLLEELTEKCKGGILLSGELDTNVLNEEREYLKSYLSGRTLVIPDRAIAQVEEDFGTVGHFRKIMFGKVNVGLERNVKKSNTIYIEDIVNTIEDAYPILLDENADGDMGYVWLDKILNNVLQPKWRNKYIDGYYENTDTAAVEFAFDCTAEIILEKAKQAVKNNKTEKQSIKRLAKAKQAVLEEQNSLLKAKAEEYKQKYEAEQRHRIEQIKKMRKFKNQIQESNKQQKERLNNRIERLERQLNTKKKVLAMGYDTIREQYEEGRTKTIYREKLGKMLNKLSKRLDGKSNNNEYIPEALKEPILNVLRTFVIEPGAYKNGKEKSIPGYFGEYKKLAEIGERVSELKDAYNSLKPVNIDDKPNTFYDMKSVVYKSGTMQLLEELSMHFGKKNIYELTASDLKDLYNTLVELDDSIREAVNIVLDGKKMSIKEASASAITEISLVNFNKDTDKFNNPKVNELWNSLKRIKDKFIATSLDPIRFGRFLSGYNDNSVVLKLFKELHNGEKKKLSILQRSMIKVQSVTAGHSLKELRALQRDDVKVFDFRDLLTGDRVKVSQGMLLSIYLTDRQADGHRHLVDEVKTDHYTVLPDLDKLNSNKREEAMNGYNHRVRFSENDLREIANYIESTPFLKQLAGAISEVFNEIHNKEINAVSMEQHGKLIATVKDYYPIKVYEDGRKSEKDFKTEINDLRMKSYGFTKTRIKTSSTIVIDDALTVFMNHTKSVSDYCGLSIPIENFKKVYNDNDGNITLHEAIARKYGTFAEHYIEKLIGDLVNKKDTLDNSVIDTIARNYMGSKLIANPGSAIKQFAAFPTANVYFGGKNVAKAAVEGVKKIDFEIYNKYTPYLWYRQEGNGTVVGEVSREVGLYKRWNNRLDIMGKTDQYVVKSLLYAAELNVEETTNLEKGTEEFYMEVVKRFEKCIDESQPNNMVTSKPQFIRNNVMRVLSLNAFRSQNMAMANCLIDGYFEWRQRKFEYDNLKNDQTKTAKEEASLKLTKTLIGIVESSILMGFLKIIAMIMMHDWDKLKDEEGNVTPLKIIENLFDSFIENLVSIFAWGDLAYETASAIVKGNNFYGLEVMSVENVNDIIDSVIKGDLVSLVTRVGDCSGLPVYNLYRVCSSINSYGNDIINGHGEIITDNKGNINTSYFANIILRAKQKGDSDKADYYEGFWIDELTKDNKMTHTEAVDYIKGKLVKVLSLYDEDIEAAALAKANGFLEEYESHYNKVINYGFDSSDVTKAINKVYKNIESNLDDRNKSEEKDIIEDLKEQGFNDLGAKFILDDIKSNVKSDSKQLNSVFDDTSSNDGKLYSYSDLFEAIINGDTVDEERIRDYLLTDGGKTKESISSALKSSSRTDPLWKEYIEVSKIGDKDRTHELWAIFTKLYSNEDNARNALRKYQEKATKK